VVVFIKHIAVHWLVKFFKNNILQGSVATAFSSGRNFNYSFVANFLPSLSVKEFWKSVTVWQRH